MGTFAICGHMNNSQEQRKTFATFVDNFSILFELSFILYLFSSNHISVFSYNKGYFVIFRAFVLFLIEVFISHTLGTKISDNIENGIIKYISLSETWLLSLMCKLQIFCFGNYFWKTKLWLILGPSLLYGNDNISLHSADFAEGNVSEFCCRI